MASSSVIMIVHLNNNHIIIIYRSSTVLLCFANTRNSVYFINKVKVHLLNIGIQIHLETFQINPEISYQIRL